MNLENICEQSRELILETGHFISGESKKISRQHVEIKSRNNFVTYVDRSAEMMLVEGLKKILPEAGFITEENTISVKGETFNWVIDPLDGTTNFIHGIPCFSISVGLMRHDRVVMGVVYEITLQECFYTWENSPAFLNGKPIKVSAADSLGSSLLATGFPFSAFERVDNYLQVTKHLMQNAQGIRRMGSAAVDLAYTACGRFEGFYEYNLNPWDVAAGTLLIQQAGGKVSDFKGGNDFIFGKEIIGACPGAYRELLEAVNRHF